MHFTTLNCPYLQVDSVQFALDVREEVTKVCSAKAQR